MFNISRLFKYQANVSQFAKIKSYNSLFKTQTKSFNASIEDPQINVPLVNLL